MRHNTLFQNFLEVTGKTGIHMKLQPHHLKFASIDERAMNYCALAREAEEAGDYERASAELRPLFSGVGEWPCVEGLSDYAAAEILLRAGEITGWLGRARKIEGIQSLARDLISASLTRFETLGNTAKIAECYLALAYCYHRGGELDETRVMLEQTFKYISDELVDTKARAILLNISLEEDANRNHDALSLYNRSALIFEKVSSHKIKGASHNEHAILLRKIGTAEKRGEYIDLAIIEYTAAIFHFNKAGNKPYAGAVENNLAFLLLTLGRYDEAHQHVRNAINIAEALKDNGYLGQWKDTRARIYLAEGRNQEAIRHARESVRHLEQGDQKALLAESLTTWGVALARSGSFSQALTQLKKAVSVAEAVGDYEGTGRALITILEELGLKLEDRITTHLEVIRLLETTQDVSLRRRVQECAKKTFEALLLMKPSNPTTELEPDFPDNFSLKEEVLRYEAQWIERAMKATGGNKSKAARLLGMKNPENLDYKINTQHDNLRHLPTATRRKSYTATRANKPGDLLQFKPSQSLKIIEVSGGSLTGLGIETGDYVILEPTTKLRDGMPIAVTDRDNIYLGYYYNDSGGFRLESDSVDEELLYFEGTNAILGVILRYVKREDAESQSCTVRWIAS